MYSWEPVRNHLFISATIHGLSPQIPPDMMTARVKDLAQHSSKGYLRSVHLVGGVIMFEYCCSSGYTSMYEQLDYLQSSIDRSYDGTCPLMLI